jgi:hypothetical protein
MSRSLPTRARMAGALGGLWHVLRSLELLRPERHMRGMRKQSSLLVLAVCWVA